MDSSINKNDGIPKIKDKSIGGAKSDISIHKNKDIIISTKKNQGITQIIDIIENLLRRVSEQKGHLSKITSSRCIGKKQKIYQ
ncbi:MAG: hypothetical protein CM15mP111_1400 [Hyphomicrobiales bacterium]|nr:MAG: hypothetical protein CM15mP111_1400 [Hyphomicrobiales bacterium]